MKTVSIALLGLLSTSAMAQEISVRAKVIGSEADLRSESATITQSSGSQQDVENDEDTQSAFGYGADIEFMLGEQARVGTGLAITDYDDGNDKLGYTDVTWSGYGSFDFVKQQLLSLYGTAGLSFHNLSLDDQKIGVATLKYEDTGLLNYDLAFGGRAKLSDQVTFGLEYKYTDTFSKNDIDVSSEGLGLLATTQTIEDVAIRKNELVASLGYSF